MNYIPLIAEIAGYMALYYLGCYAFCRAVTYLNMIWSNREE